MILKNRFASWVEDYSDVSPCIELMALYDDVLKKNDNFCKFAVDVANRIIGDLEIKNCKATWGKWGARLETEENKEISRDDLEYAAIRITDHPSWIALKIVTHVFTFGKQGDEE